MTKPIDQLNKEDKQVLDSVVERSNKSPDMAIKYIWESNPEKENEIKDKFINKGKEN